LLEPTESLFVQSYIVYTQKIFKQALYFCVRQ
jgi:hypothetical protein